MKPSTLNSFSLHSYNSKSFFFLIRYHAFPTPGSKARSQPGDSKNGNLRTTPQGLSSYKSANKKKGSKLKEGGGQILRYQPRRKWNRRGSDQRLRDRRRSLVPPSKTEDFAPFPAFARLPFPYSLFPSTLPLTDREFFPLSLLETIYSSSSPLRRFDPIERLEVSFGWRRLMGLGHFSWVPAERPMSVQNPNRY